jgi:hypothetical protein
MTGELARQRQGKSGRQVGKKASEVWTPFWGGGVTGAHGGGRSTAGGTGGQVGEHWGVTARLTDEEVALDGDMRWLAPGEDSWLMDEERSGIGWLGHSEQELEEETAHMRQRTRLAAHRRCRRDLVGCSGGMRSRASGGLRSMRCEMGKGKISPWLCFSERIRTLQGKDCSGAVATVPVAMATASVAVRRQGIVRSQARHVGTQHLGVHVKENSWVGQAGTVPSRTVAVGWAS